MTDVDLRYLEGRAAIGARIQAIAGGKPSDQQRSFAASCLLHGRLFWQSAASATLETKPLLLYYGAAAYAKALVIAFTGCRPEDLHQAHGLVGAAKNGQKIADFNIQTKGDGLFQQFNDVVASTNRIDYFENASPHSKMIPCASSDKLAKLELSLSECFAHIPDLQSSYQLCTGQPSKVQRLYFDTSFGSPEHYGLRVDIPGHFEGTDSLQSIIDAIRKRTPFLQRWRVHSASNAWGNSVIEFANMEPTEDEVRSLVGEEGHYQAQTKGTYFDPFEHLPPLAGGAGAGSAYIEPINGEHVCEFSLMFAALFGLSSLVRYHPHIWTACVYRQQIANRSVDDAMLPVVEQFLGLVGTRFPNLVTKLLLG